MTTPAGIDPRGPRFAATITTVLLLVATFLGLIGISTAAAFIAAFLNAAFSFCLGCQIYLLLQRAGVIGRAASA